MMKTRKEIRRELYKASEVAEMFGLKLATIYKWIKNGQLKTVRIRNRLYIPRKEIEKLIGEF